MPSRIAAKTRFSWQSAADRRRPCARASRSGRAGTSGEVVESGGKCWPRRGGTRRRRCSRSRPAGTAEVVDAAERLDRGEERSSASGSALLRCRRPMRAFGRIRRKVSHRLGQDLFAMGDEENAAELGRSLSNAASQVLPRPVASTTSPAVLPPPAFAPAPLGPLVGSRVVRAAAAAVRIVRPLQRAAVFYRPLIGSIHPS